MNTIQRLILENKAWAEAHSKADPTYFKLMAESQNPEILWIGGSDSRVPPSEIINTRPGDIFVHRNIGNLVYLEDENLMSVIEYAVGCLKVKIIIVCGHYGCGGVQAAFDEIDNPRLKQWTRMIADLKKEKQPKSLKELVELNVIQQVKNLKEVPIIKNLEKTNDAPEIVGWVYDLESGLMKQL